MSVATVVGAATTGTFLGAPGAGGVATVLGALVLLVTGAIAAGVVSRGAGAVPFAASVVWALPRSVPQASTPDDHAQRVGRADVPRAAA